LVRYFGVASSNLGRLAQNFPGNGRYEKVLEINAGVENVADISEPQALNFK